jgi:hypothetical protein
MIDIHKITPKIQEVMEFQILLIVKLNFNLEISFLSSVWTLKQILPDLNNVCIFSHL